MEKKFTRLGEINSDFDVFKLKSALVKNDAGDWGDEPKDDAVGLIRSTNFTNQGLLDLSKVAYRSLKPKKLKEKKLYEGEILIERSGGSDVQPVGRVGYINDEIANDKFAFANFIQRIAVDDTIEPKFLYYCLQQMYEMGVTASMQYQTTGIRNLDWKLYTKSFLPKPNKTEQHTIASILSKVDDTIAATKNSIARAERLKTAFIQNLLVGNLKFDGSWRKKDEFYIDEKVGNVPKGWKVMRIKEIGKFYGGSTPSTSEPSYWNGNINWLVPSDISSLPSSQKFLKETSQKITEQGFKSCSTMLLQPGTLCLSSRATIGDCIISETEICTNQGFINIVFSDNKIAYNVFVLFWIRQSKNYILKYAAGTTFGEIGRGTFKKLIIALPPYEEQVLISNKIVSLDNILQSKETKIKKLERLKKALMQNLLMGKVRVKKPKLKEH